MTFGKISTKRDHYPPRSKYEPLFQYRMPNALIDVMSLKDALHSVLFHLPIREMHTGFDGGAITKM